MTGRKRADPHGEEGGLAVWLLALLRRRVLLGRMRCHGNKPRMELVERIALGPRQNLALVEADGRRILIATSGEGGPVFHALDRAQNPPAARQARVSW